MEINKLDSLTDEEAFKKIVEIFKRHNPEDRDEFYTIDRAMVLLQESKITGAPLINVFKSSYPDLFKEEFIKDTEENIATEDEFKDMDKESPQKIISVANIQSFVEGSKDLFEGAKDLYKNIKYSEPKKINEIFSLTDEEFKAKYGDFSVLAKLYPNLGKYRAKYTIISAYYEGITESEYLEKTGAFKDKLTPAEVNENINQNEEMDKTNNDPLDGIREIVKNAGGQEVGNNITNSESLIETELSENLNRDRE